MLPFVNTSKRNKLSVYVLTISVIVCLSLLYYQTVPILVTAWNTNPDYSHGYIIPLISLYMIWYALRHMTTSDIHPSNWGLIPLILGVVIQVAAVVGSEHFLQGVSIIIVLWGLGFYLGGAKIAIRLVLPIGYLIFMIPLPSIIWNKFSFILKLYATDFAVNLLALTGQIALMQEGNIIHLSAGSLEVADACSGLRSLISMLALGVLIAFISRYALWKKYLLVFLAIPIAMAANILRLMILVVLADRYGISVAESFMHTLSGVLVFAVGFLLLIGVQSFLILNYKNG